MRKHLLGTNAFWKQTSLTHFFGSNTFLDSAPSWNSYFSFSNFCGTLHRICLARNTLKMSELGELSTLLHFPWNLTSNFVNTFPLIILNCHTVNLYSTSYATSSYYGLTAKAVVRKRSHTKPLSIKRKLNGNPPPVRLETESGDLQLWFRKLTATKAFAT